jgi:hypothetical protein
MAWHGISVHGTSIVAELLGATRFLTFGPGTDWTDVVGYRRGWGTIFRGIKNTFNWFHYSIPTLSLEGHMSAALGELRLSFLTTGTTRVESVHVWDGHVQPRAFNNLGVAGDFRTKTETGRNLWLFQPPLDMRNGGLGVSIGVAFGAQDSDILFTSAYARFTAP